MRSELITPPAIEPITLADAKLHLRVDFADDDSLITQLIAAARRKVETDIRQALITQTWIVYQDGFPVAGGFFNPTIRQIWASSQSLPAGTGFFPGMVTNSNAVIDLIRPPIQSVVSVKYFDVAGVLNTIDPSKYIVSTKFPGRIQPQYSQFWPYSRATIDSVQITTINGYGDTATTIPENLIAAMKLLIGTWYEHRESVNTGMYMIVPMAYEALLAVSDHGTWG